MATTTPNYGWDVPTSTDYVKDGAVAIETLGDDIDASLFAITGGKNVGLVPVNTTNFTTQSAVQIDSIFTSAFDNYFFAFNITASSVTNNAIRVQMVDGTTPQTGATYSYAGNGVTSTNSITNTVGTGLTSFTFMWTDSGAADLTNGVFNIISPNKAVRTGLTFQTYNYNGTSDWCYNGGGVFNATTQLEGIRFIPNSGTISGTIRVYGYRNS
jgi:hypothetical protein